jgi:hypothetical protein
LRIRSRKPGRREQHALNRSGIAERLVEPDEGILVEIGDRRSVDREHLDYGRRLEVRAVPGRHFLPGTSRRPSDDEY